MFKKYKEVNPVMRDFKNGRVRVEQDTERYWRVYEMYDGVWELSSKHARYDKAMRVAHGLCE